MKKKLLWMIVAVLTLSLCLVSCAQNGDGGVVGGGGGGYMSPASVPQNELDYSASERTDASKSKESTGETTEEKTDAGEITEERVDDQRNAGLITACAWDDNHSYSDWKTLFAKEDANTKAGKFSEYTDNAWKFDTLSRVKVTVKNGENFVCGATISCFGADQKEYKAVTNANGVAYLFPADAEGTIKVKSGENEAEAAFTAENRELTVDLTPTVAKDNIIKLMFVIDVTGSMGDELNYITNELADVIGRVSNNDNQTRIDLAFLFYRDDGDKDKLDYVGFKNVTDSAGLAEQQQILSTKYATGGGDYPEALDEALLLAVSKDWGEENSTKIIFHVFDAPSHSNADNRTRCRQAAEIAAEKGIRYCPILCSGADILCEYIARQGAVYTGGTFIFVTDHSGIGNPHYDPNVPNAVVEKLNDMMVRLILGYHTGAFADPVPWNAK